VATPPSANRAAQQRRLDAFRLDFNQQGPHEALGQTPPGRHYQPSLRPPYPSRLEDPAYPADCELRRARRMADHVGARDSRDERNGPQGQSPKQSLCSSTHKRHAFARRPVPLLCLFLRC